MLVSRDVTSAGNVRAGKEARACFLTCTTEETGDNGGRPDRRNGVNGRQPSVPTADYGGNWGWHAFAAPPVLAEALESQRGRESMARQRRVSVPTEDNGSAHGGPPGQTAGNGGWHRGHGVNGVPVLDESAGSSWNMCQCVPLSSRGSAKRG
jgi:hypothetical protein